MDESRKRIDAIDSEIVKLLNERAEVVQEIGKLKRKTKKTFYVPDREKKVLDALARKSKGPLPNAAIRAIFKEVISASRSLEKPFVISYWGPKGTFTHLASIHRFGLPITGPSRASPTSSPRSNANGPTTVSFRWRTRPRAW